MCSTGRPGSATPSCYSWPAARSNAWLTARRAGHVYPGCAAPNADPSGVRHTDNDFRREEGPTGPVEHDDIRHAVSSATNEQGMAVNHRDVGNRRVSDNHRRCSAGDTQSGGMIQGHHKRFSVRWSHGPQYTRYCSGQDEQGDRSQILRSLLAHVTSTPCPSVRLSALGNPDA